MTNYNELKKTIAEAETPITTQEWIMLVDHARLGMAETIDAIATAYNLGYMEGKLKYRSIPDVKYPKTNK